MKQKAKNEKKNVNLTKTQKPVFVNGWSSTRWRKKKKTGQAGLLTYRIQGQMQDSLWVSSKIKTHRVVELVTRGCSTAAGGEGADE